MPIQVPQLQIPDAPDIAGSYGKGVQIRNLMQAGQQQQAMAPGQQVLQQQQIQAGQQGIQQNEMQLKQQQQDMQDQQTIQQAASAHNGSLIDALPELVGKVSPKAYAGVVDHIDKKKKEIADLTKVEAENQKSASDNMLGLITEASQLPPEQYQQMQPQIIARAIEINPKLKGQIDPSKPIPQNELSHLGIGLTLESQLASQSLQKRAENAARLAEKTQAENAKTADRKNYEYAVDHDKYAGTFEKWLKENKKSASGAEGTLSLQEDKDGNTVLFNNKTGESRPAPAGLVPKGEKLKSEATVTGIEPGTGRAVQTSVAEAKRLGLTDVNKALAADVGKTNSARHWLELANKQGNPKDSSTMGILPLIEKLDKSGKLGTIASRWNDFMAGKVGAGDPDFEALRAKMGLGTTLLMQAHVGNRGGSYMLEHFEDLANAKKMDAQTLKSGIKSEIDYMKDRAMLPSAEAGGGKITVTAPDGSKHPFDTQSQADAFKKLAGIK